MKYNVIKTNSIVVNRSPDVYPWIDLSMYELSHENLDDENYKIITDIFHGD